MPKIYIQEIHLESHEQSARIPLDWDELSGTEGWKALSWVRNKPTWVEPRLIANLYSHPNQASNLILLKSPDWSTTLAIYPISTISTRINLIVIDGVVYANARKCTPGSDEKVWVVCALASTRTEERRIVQKVVKKGRELVGGNEYEQIRDDIWDGLGVCTWESLGNNAQRPNKDNLLALVPDIPIKTFLIDDGWQDRRSHLSDPKNPNSTERKTLFSFNAWSGMGSPMSDVVSSIKAKGVKYVGVWVTLQGYWFGIHPDSPLIEKYECKPYRLARWGQARGGVNVPLEQDDRGEVQWHPSAEKAVEFWQDYMREIKSWGVDFVKVDNQGQYDGVVDDINFRHAQESMWSGMLAAVQDTWGSVNRVIMCMAHTERILNGPGGLGVGRPPGNLIFRNSDDFNLKYSQTHPDHIKYNLYQTILTTHLSLIPHPRFRHVRNEPS